jgi:hypothetical protein
MLIMSSSLMKVIMMMVMRMIPAPRMEFQWGITPNISTWNYTKSL